MSGERVKRIALQGELRGSALLRESGEKTQVELNVRGLKDGMRLLAYGKSGLAGAVIGGSNAELPAVGVCALAIESGGRTVLSGFSGECAGDRKRILARLKVFASQQSGSAAAVKQPVKKAPEKEAQRQEETKPRAEKSVQRHGFFPSADITRGILEAARMLFGPSPETGPVLKSDSEPETFTPVPNPFPRTFPGSVWRKKQGDMRLYGELEKNGQILRLVAVPAGAAKGQKHPNLTRAVISNDGVRYFVGKEGSGV